MQDNIRRMLANHEDVEALADRSTELLQNSMQLRSNAARLKRRMRCGQRTSRTARAARVGAAQSAVSQPRPLTRDRTAPRAGKYWKWTLLTLAAVAGVAVFVMWQLQVGPFSSGSLSPVAVPTAAPMAAPTAAPTAVPTAVPTATLDTLHP